MNEVATVIKADKRVKIRIQQRTECSSCRACAFGKKSYIDVFAKGDVKVDVGDKVNVELPKKRPLSASATLFVLPLALFALALSLSYRLGELYSLIIALASLVASFVILLVIDKKIYSKINVARIISIISDDVKNNNDNLTLIKEKIND